MAAIVEIHSFHGSGTPTATDVTSQDIRFKRADDDTPGFATPAADSIPIGVTAPNYSWRKHLKLYAKEGVKAWIANVKFFADVEKQNWEDQIVLYCKVSSSYTQGSVSDETTQLSSSFDANDRNSNNPLVVKSAGAVAESSGNPPSGGGAGPVYSGGTGGDPIPIITEDESYGFQDYVVLQLAVLPGCTSEIKTERTLSYRYDEQ